MIREWKEIKNFEKWNEEMAKKYNLDHYFNRSGFLVRFLEEKRRKTISKILEVTENNEVIEIGCGAGHILEIIEKGHLTGLDLSEFLLGLAKEKLKDKKVNLVKGDAQNLPPEIRNKKFDKIICSELLEHVPNPEKVIDEILEIAHPKSVVVISISNEKIINKFKKAFIKLKIFSILFPNITRQIDNEWHLHNLDLDTLKRITYRKLKITKIKALPFLFLPIRYVVKLEPCKIR